MPKSVQLPMVNNCDIGSGSDFDDPRSISKDSNLMESLARNIRNGGQPVDQLSMTNAPVSVRENPSSMIASLGVKNYSGLGI